MTEFQDDVDYGLEDESGAKSSDMYHYPAMTKTMTGKSESAAKMKFVLHVEAGSFTDSEIVVMLGEWYR